MHSYELLFRTAARNPSGEGGQSDSATSSVILAAFQDIGIERLAGDRPVAINLSPGLLGQASNLPVTPQRVTFDLPLELMEPRAVPALRELKSLGFTLALDAFRFDRRLAPIYELADLIKIDVRTTDPVRLARLANLIAKLGARSVAKKVETLDEYEQLRDQGFELFQGYFLSRPRIVRTRNLAPGKHAVLSLLAKLYDPHSETGDIEVALGSDPALSYKLIRLINSAFFSLPRNIGSLRDAIVLLGRDKLATWAALIALGQIEDRPSEILRIALARAKMCERLAENAGHRGGDGFVVGLFSSLDLLLERPLEGLLEPLPLAQSLRSAILEHSGPLGAVLKTVLAYERNDWADITSAALPVDALREASIEALDWANSLGGLLGDR
ncbi:MAG: HDOD domain-containing protein [Acidihalobacter sp.]